MCKLQYIFAHSESICQKLRRLKMAYDKKTKSASAVTRQATAKKLAVPKMTTGTTVTKGPSVRKAVAEKALPQKQASAKQAITEKTTATLPRLTTRPTTASPQDQDTAKPAPNPRSPTDATKTTSINPKERLAMIKEAPTTRPRNATSYWDSRPRIGPRPSVR